MRIIKELRTWGPGKSWTLSILGNPEPSRERKEKRLYMKKRHTLGCAHVNGSRNSIKIRLLLILGGYARPLDPR